jgi:hypothetical protein
VSDPVDFVDNSIGQLLVALADGVREAERALAAGPQLDDSGRAVTRYALPYLDFTINVDVEVATPPVTGGPRGLPVLRLFTRPASPASDNREIRSSVSGRLVAVPAGDGLPLPRIRLTPGPNIEGKAAIGIVVSNSAGELLAGQPVELNIDSKASETVSKARGVPALPRRDGTRLAAGIVTTDGEGRATTALLIDAAEPARALFVVTASIGPYSAQATISAEVLG